MKKLLTISILALLSACGGKESKTDESVNILENLTYSMDTLVVDAGEDFLNLSHGLYPFTLTEDKTLLYFFERDPYRLVEVDLDNLKVLKKTEFEEEGPDGIGPYLSRMEIGPSGDLFLQSNVTSAVFDQHAKKLRELKFVPSGIDSSLSKNYNALYAFAVYDFGTQKIYTQPRFEDAGEYGLFILNPEAKSARSLPVHKMKSVSDFSRTYSTESGGNTWINFFSVNEFLLKENGHLLISAAPMSGFYQMNLETDSIEYIDIQHKTVPNEWNITVMDEYSDETIFKEDRRKVSEQLNYMAVNWDETREMYLRLGIKTYLGETPEDPSTTELYLFSYDEDFNVLGETRLEGLEADPWYYFWKDGKLYSYVNVEDELGFAVFTFNF